MLPRERGGSNARCSPHRLAKRAPPRLVIGRQLNATMVFGRAREKRRSWSRLAPRGMLWEYPSHRNATAAPGNGGAVIPASHAKCTSAFAPGTCVRRLHPLHRQQKARRPAAAHSAGGSGPSPARARQGRPLSARPC
ncbi:unnamed protein product [Prorocentrum cordatum]|uniref:Uncharacterized protein n=1 Tax=Prorocentrum cordatum TaxID=2364126 RepID=A0ABN9UF66_9DINO|nr:unnamed protein product [Polarella glacialis]